MNKIKLTFFVSCFLLFLCLGYAIAHSSLINMGIFEYVIATPLALITCITGFIVGISNLAEIK